MGGVADEIGFHQERSDRFGPLGIQTGCLEQILGEHPQLGCAISFGFSCRHAAFHGSRVEDRAALVFRTS
jgi:hypothetical protein